jgi:nicotinamide-nucleotide amidase
MSIPHLGIVCIGTELTQGRVINTNAAWLSEHFLGLGIPTRFHRVCTDDRDEIIRTLRAAAKECDLLLITGGLGPTDDDRTQETVASAMGSTLIRNAAAAKQVTKRLATYGREADEWQLRQADIPVGAEPLLNQIGTAPGFVGFLMGTPFAVLPGVPSEMKWMVQKYLKKWIHRLKIPRGRIYRKLWNLVAVPEPDVDRVLDELRPLPKKEELGLTVHEGVLTISHVVLGGSAEAARKRHARVNRLVRSRLGRSLFSTGQVGLAETILKMMRKRGLRLAVAESCTGGRLASAFVEIPGASDVLTEGFVTYSNDAKQSRLRVTEESLTTHGAVSAEVAAEMAAGARWESGADVAVSVTGIAGPDGGSADKPVGLVWFGVASAAGVTTHRLNRPGPRERIQRRAVNHALYRVWRTLKEVE